MISTLILFLWLWCQGSMASQAKPQQQRGLKGKMSEELIKKMAGKKGGGMKKGCGMKKGGLDKKAPPVSKSTSTVAPSNATWLQDDAISTVDDAEDGSESTGAAAPGLLDPRLQPKFTVIAPDPFSNTIIPADQNNSYIQIGIYSVMQKLGLIDPDTGAELETSVFAYGLKKSTASWPGPTILVKSNETILVDWKNNLFNVTYHPFTGLNGKSPIDKSIHWAFALPGYQQYTAERDGIPIVSHVHGLSTEDGYDGNPEYFITPGSKIKGPRWKYQVYTYDNTQPAALLWYHDHALGLTRLNVHSGLAGFYVVRDEYDTGLEDNPLGLPVGDYEKAYVIQDRMFKENGNLFYPAFKGEPYYEDFIDGEEADWDSDVDGASTLTEVFGDFIVVNGKIWPKQDVEPAVYRIRLLNGCDSRFLILEFRAVELGAENADSGELIPYTVIGTDQGLLASPIDSVNRSLIELGARLDIVIDFSAYQNKRIIVTNLGGDEPFGGDIPGPRLYEFTDRIMAFDVGANILSGLTEKLSWTLPAPSFGPVAKVRSVGLFEGKDQYGRLQPLLGGLKGTTLETMGWGHPTTETPAAGTTEEWIIFNFSEDAHPIHLHQVFFQVVSRHPIIFDSLAIEEGFLNNTLDQLTSGQLPSGPPPLIVPSPSSDGVYLERIPFMQHDGAIGTGVHAVFPGLPENFLDRNTTFVLGQEYSSEIGGRKDVVTAMPGQATIIRTTFRRRGRFVWHCHILAHEDHEMMRVFEVL